MEAARTRRLRLLRPGRRSGSLALLAASLVVLVQTGDASASTLVWSHACSADLDPGVCERVGYLAQLATDGGGGLAAINAGVWAAVGAVIGAPLAVMLVRSLFAGRD